MIKTGEFRSIFKKLFTISKNIIRYDVRSIKATNKIHKPQLNQYQAIKNKQKHTSFPSTNVILDNPPISQSIPKENNEKVSRNHPQYKQQHSHVRCEGCNTFLQFKNNKKYGFINQKVYKQAIQQNTNVFNQTYGQRVRSGDAQVIDFLHQIQKQSGIQIFQKNNKPGSNQTNNENKFKNLDNVNVLLLLQQKIDRYEQQNQTLKRSKKMRKQLYCYRCYSLKYHNHLPQQYDDQIYEGGLNLDRQIVLEKVFNKHKPFQDKTHYLFVIDVLDIFGTLRKDLIFKLLQKNCNFSIVINKCDILNEKYLVQTNVHREVKKLLKQYLKEYQSFISSQTQFHGFSSEEVFSKIKVFFVSSISREGIKKIQQFMNQGLKRIQLFGLPNTGKTSLLNKLLRSQKLTSKIPGTTVRVSQHIYRDKIRIFDMPGLHYTDLMYNLILKPSLKSVLTWSKFYSPPLMTHSCFIYGGKIQAQGLRIIPFGMGGCCSSDNRWFILNYKQFWKGLPGLDQLKMTKYQHKLIFKQGKSQDLQIAGYGFVGFKSCVKGKQNFQTKIVLYLPQKISFNFRQTVLKQDKIFHNKSAFTKRHQLQRIHKQSNAFQ